MTLLRESGQPALHHFVLEGLDGVGIACGGKVGGAGPAHNAGVASTTVQLGSRPTEGTPKMRLLILGRRVVRRTHHAPPSWSFDPRNAACKRRGPEPAFLITGDQPLTVNRGVPPCLSQIALMLPTLAKVARRPGPTTDSGLSARISCRSTRSRLEPPRRPPW